MFRLCLVTNVGDRPLPDYLQFLRAAVRGGVDCVEWREKNQAMTKIDQVHAIKKMLDEMGVPLLINDYPEICKMIDASGVHLGNSDMAVATARGVIGHGKIIGLSIESEEDIFKADAADNIDYVTASAVFASKNKNDTKKIWGIDGLKTLLAQRHQDIASKPTKPISKPIIKPMTAIGGITMDNVAAVMATGVYGVAVVGALHDAKTPEEASNIAKDLRRIIDASAVDRNKS